MPKKLVIFCDGTWNRADQKNLPIGRPSPTNVLRLFEATLSHDLGTPPNPQIVQYIAGVGTRKWERIRGGGFGYGISENIKSAYQFIVSNYDPGDEIFLFGFSRGAFTARSIAGLIRNMGILRRDRLHLADEAYEHYKDRSDTWHPDSEQSKRFREANTHGDETIEFLGVWETVGALGAPFGAVSSWIVDLLFRVHFHDVRLSSIVQSAYHALAIDEHRWPFRPTLWTLNEVHLQRNANSPQPLYEHKWFPGVHSNVGGGYPAPHSRLADCTLKWMAEKAQHRGLNVDLSKIQEPRFAPDAAVAISDSQNLLYRVLTVLFVKLPSLISSHLVYPKEGRPYVGHLKMNGDYVRPIPDAGDLSQVALEKLEIDTTYKPDNVPR